MGASKATLIDAFKLFVRSKLETAVPLWAGAITEKDKNSIERVQVNALKAILGNEYSSYSQELENMNLDQLTKRRDKICVKFAKKLKVFALVFQKKLKKYQKQ